ncbi:helix-turn-helix domain-containing protein [Hymenobacter terricola]|uniref:helix-turn-helix domain-containing protein n=1 Tax=Hymenobacter terricola TaxID=2819236 RepID=UPI001B31845F
MVERIRLLLDTRQLTPTQFADAIGIARPIVSHILSGRNKPSLEVVQRILAAMPDLSMPWLLNGTGPMLAATAGPPAVSPLLTQMAAKEAETPSIVPAFSPVAPAPSIAAVPPPRRSGPPVIPAAKPVGAIIPTPKQFVLPPKPGFAPVPPAPQSPDSAEVPNVPAPQPEIEEQPTPVVPVAAADDVKSAVALPSAPALFVGIEKPIRRIVIFYRDGSFADYQPE